jgi:hypothetical protein
MKVKVFIVDPCGAEHWLQVPQGQGAIDVYEVDEEEVEKYDDLELARVLRKRKPVETLAGYVIVVLEGCVYLKFLSSTGG